MLSYLLKVKNFELRLSKFVSTLWFDSNLKLIVNEGDYHSVE